MDDHDARGSGRRRGDDSVADATPPGLDQDYSWESKPGEDFGPIPPPSADPAPRASRRPAATLDAAPRTGPDTPTRRLSVDDGDRFDEPRSTARRSPPSRRPLLLALMGLIVLLGIVAAVLVVPTLQLTAPDAPPADDLESTPVLATPTRNISSATVTLATAVPPAGASPAAAPAASPTPLTLTQITPAVSPVPTRPIGAAASPSARTTPVIAPSFPTPAALPPGLRFATSTPARLGTPAATRTPLTVPTVRPAAFLNRVWSEQTIYKVGDRATICGTANAGSEAELVVLGPDRSVKTVGQFQPPAERVCQSMDVDQTGLYVLTMIVKDANGTELERQSAALWVGR